MELDLAKYRGQSSSSSSYERVIHATGYGDRETTLVSEIKNMGRICNNNNNTTTGRRAVGTSLFAVIRRSHVFACTPKHDSLWCCLCWSYIVGKPRIGRVGSFLESRLDFHCGFDRMARKVRSRAGCAQNCRLVGYKSVLLSLLLLFCTLTQLLLLPDSHKQSIGC